MSASVVVVGSINVDIVVAVPHIPAPGETVLGADSFRNAGGKGANQAVTAARLGRHVAMIGRVGDDADGAWLVSGLDDAGVDVTAVLATGEVPTGTAWISVDPRGENAIVVSPGANARVTARDVESSSEAVGNADAVLLQLEIPLEAVMAAAAAARGRVILNPAPARPLPRELMERVDVLVPNRLELATLTGAPEPSAFDEVVDLVLALEGPRSTVVTLGAEGAAVVAGGRAVHVPAVDVTPVDTTAGGDCFCGALADALVGGATLGDAAGWATRAAAIAITRRGAQSSLPTREEVEALQ